MERLIGILMLVVLVVVLFDWETPLERTAAENAVCKGRNTAWTMAKALVRQNLGNPLAAGFPNRATAEDLGNMSFHYMGGCRYRISSFVYAYYRHRGLKRRYFVVELSYHGQGGWRMDELAFTESPNSPTGLTSENTQKGSRALSEQRSVGFSGQKAGMRQFRHTQEVTHLRESVHGFRLHTYD